jgi:hypothetical protein
MLDQAPGDGGARPVELGGAVGGLAQQHHLGVAEPVEQGAEGLLVVEGRQGLPLLAHHRDGLLDRGVVLALLPGKPRHGRTS